MTHLTDIWPLGYHLIEDRQLCKWLSKYITAKYTKIEWLVF